MIHYFRNYILFGLSVVLLHGCMHKKSSAHEKPNIIFILTDDLGYGDIEPYGQKIIQTPNLARLANEGILFSNAYCGTSVCAPSRAVLMTGRHAGHCEIRGNKEVEPEGQMPLSAQAVTVAQVLKSAGYTTALIGKWGLGVEGTTGDPLTKGFDSYYGFLDQVRAHNSFPDYLLRNGVKEKLQNELIYMPETHWSKGVGSYAVKKVDYVNDLFTKEALNYITQKKEKPFFLYLSYTTPHDNGEAPADKRIEALGFGSYADKQEWNENEKSYAAIITRLDEQIGQLVDKLQKEGIAEKTLIIFTSDNGPERYGIERFNSNGPFRGIKRDLYEGGIRMPFIAYWPNSIKHAIVERPIAFWDFFPTACELAGVKPPAETDGVSFVPTLLGKNQPEPSFLYFELIESATRQQAVRMGDWKVIRFYRSSGTVTEMYNLKNDPGEEKNVAFQYPAIIEKADAIFAKERTEDVNWPLQIHSVNKK